MSLPPLSALLIELTCREATLELAIHAARALPSRIHHMRNLAQIRRQIDMTALEFLRLRPGDALAQAPSVAGA